jgi:hypothetical protein
VITSANSLGTGKQETRRGTAPPEANSAFGAECHPVAAFFDHLPQAFGTQECAVRAGRISARLQGLSSRQSTELVARYGIFARPAEQEATDLAVEVRPSPTECFLRVKEGPEPELYRLLTRHEHGVLLAWSYEWAARIDFEAGEAVLAVCSDERVVFDRAVENFLRVAFAHLALKKGSILLHGAAVVRNGRAFVFFGPSGSGKTTATMLSRGCLVLSDDLILIAPRGSEFAAASVPFRGLLTPPATTNECHDLAGLFRLVKDETDQVEEIAPSRAAGEIVQSLPFVTDRPEDASRVLEVVGNLVNAAPVSRLHFRKDPGFWGVIDP